MHNRLKIRIVKKGNVRYVAQSLFSLIKITLIVRLRRLFGKSINTNWSADTEIGNLFWRNQFDRALKFKNISDGREYFDSLQIYYGDEPRVTESVIDNQDFKGVWLTPPHVKSDIKILYFHGGGYTFFAAVTKNFIKMLSEYLGLEIFMADYPLTPENSHPSQLNSALKAYKYMIETGQNPNKLVLMGDSAGGHLTLMSLIGIKDQKLPMPALAIGLCPWTHTGNYGESLYKNNRYDLVQGYMALQFGEWLKKNNFDDSQISPMFKDYFDCAPIYLQGGSHEILIDMIVDFALKNQKLGVEIVLDVFKEMTHEFQANGIALHESALALERISQAINYFVNRSNENVEFQKLEISMVFNINKNAR